MYVKCWDCGQELEADIDYLLRREYLKGYSDGFRESFKYDADSPSCATTKNRIREYGNTKR